MATSFSVKRVALPPKPLTLPGKALSSESETRSVLCDLRTIDCGLGKLRSADGPFHCASERGGHVNPKGAVDAASETETQ